MLLSAEARDAQIIRGARLMLRSRVLGDTLYQSIRRSPPGKVIELTSTACRLAESTCRLIECFSWLSDFNDDTIASIIQQVPKEIQRNENHKNQRDEFSDHISDVSAYRSEVTELISGACSVVEFKNNHRKSGTSCARVCHALHRNVEYRIDAATCRPSV